MPCNGNGKDHCCYIKGEACHNLVENDPRAPERRWACGLYLDVGKDWDKVLASDRYPKDAWANGLNCRDWPDGEGVNRGYCPENGCRD